MRSSQTKRLYKYKKCQIVSHVCDKVSSLAICIVFIDSCCQRVVTIFLQKLKLSVFAFCRLFSLKWIWHSQCDLVWREVITNSNIHFINIVWLKIWMYDNFETYRSIFDSFDENSCFCVWLTIVLLHDFVVKVVSNFEEKFVLMNHSRFCNRSLRFLWYTFSRKKFRKQNNFLVEIFLHSSLELKLSWQSLWWR